MKILIYPTSINPYHELLYRPLRSQHPRDSYTYLAASPLNLIFFPLALIAKRLRGYNVFHLHWHTFYLDAKYGIPGRKGISFINTVASLLAIKLLGYKLIWTVHNVLPHEQQTSSDTYITRLTARLASQLIVHSTHTITELREVGADAGKTTVIPHGNYAGMYPRSLSRAAARAGLGLQPSETAVLFFGNLRPHKGIEELIAAFMQLQPKNTKLIIAGACRDAGLGKTIIAFAKKHKNILYVEGNIPDKDVAMYFDAADVACMPFKTVTTSGSILLAATFGKPLVTPRLGAIQDMPPEVGVLYDPNQPHALKNALQKALQSRATRATMARAAQAYAETLSWNVIAAKTYQVYRNSLAKPRSK